MIRRVVIDTNVIVSALLFGGTPGELIPLWKDGRIQPLVSKEIIEEYIHVLTYPKFDLKEKEIQYLIYQQLLPFFEVVETKTGRIIIPNDPSDDKFIRCAISGTADFIVSGDMHLRILKTYHHIRILNPAQLLEIIDTL